MFPKFRVLRFFTYATNVRQVLSSYDTHTGAGDNQLEDVYNLADKQAKTLWKSKSFADNKSAFEILIGNTILYIGMYDGVYRLGLAVDSFYGNEVKDILSQTSSSFGHWCTGWREEDEKD